MLWNLDILILLIYSCKYVLVQKLIPEKILLEPYSCVNISVIDEGNFELSSIELYGKKNHFLLSYYPVSQPFDSINYYYFKYVFEIGELWIGLCEIDEILEGSSLSFVLKTNDIETKLVSDTIKIGPCNFCNDCTEFIFKPDYFILKKIVLSNKHSKIYNEGLEFLSGKGIYKMGLCFIYEGCQYFFSRTNTFITTLYDNYISYDGDIQELFLDVKNYFISQYTLNFFYSDDEINQIFVITFIINPLFLQYRLDGSEIYFKYISSPHPVAYRVYFSFDESIYLNFDSFKETDTPRIISPDFIIWSSSDKIIVYSGNRKYALLFVEFVFQENGYKYYYNINIYIGKSHKLFSNSDFHQNIEENLYTTLTERSLNLKFTYNEHKRNINKKKYIFIGMSCGIIFFISGLALLYKKKFSNLKYILKY